MPLTCLVVPRAGLAPAGCRCLGEALHRWLSADPAARSIDRLGMDDLRDGELPQPYYRRAIWIAEGRARPAGGPGGKALSREERDEIRSGLGDRADSRALECQIGAAAGEDVRLAVLSFDRVVPRHLVDDILIDGRSWKGFARGS